MNSCLHVLTLWLAICVGSLSAHSRMFMSARVGSSVVLPCNWRNVSSQNPHIEWRTFSETVLERRGNELYECDEYKGRVDVPKDKLLKGDCSLLLKNITSEDAGVYESYLLVKRHKRALGSKRVFLQSVELSVDDTPQEPIKTQQKALVETNEVQVAKQDKLRGSMNNAGTIQTSSWMVTFFLIFFYTF